MWRWTGSRGGSGSASDPPRPPGSAAAGGFTLIEVLIAFVILALALGALLPGFSAGLRGLDAADDYATAAMFAESRLAAVGREAPMEEGTTSGEFDERFSWRLDVTALPEADPEGVLPVLPYGVVLTVSWGERDGRSIVVETLRLGPPPPRLGSAR